MKKTNKRLTVLGQRNKTKEKKHTTLGIRWWSPTQLLVQRSVAYLRESGRDPELSTAYGRMYQRNELM